MMPNADIHPISNHAALRLGIQTLISAIQVQVGTELTTDLPSWDEQVRAGFRLGHLAGERYAKTQLLSELRNLLAATR